MHEKCLSLWNRSKRLLIFIIMVTLGSQICLHLANSVFVISLGCVFLAAIFYLFDDIPPLSTAILSGLMIYCSRVIFYYLQYGEIGNTLNTYGPEIAFYFTFGLFLMILNTFSGFRKRITTYVPCIIFMDFFCNSLELYIRTGLGASLGLTEQKLIVIAFCRGLVLFFILLSLKRYRVMLLSETHAQRYQRLMVLISRLSGEIVWMDKNAAQIENTMSTAYTLYGDLAEEKSNLAPQALEIAKNIHEIKKEYLLIKRGLSQALETETTNDSIPMNELLQILAKSVENEYRESEQIPTFTIELEDNLTTKNPYLFLSVFHNLATNAIEATKGTDVQMIIHETRIETVYRYTFQDNGPGIDPAYRDQIFTPRFSTKINFDTGEISRGLGLSIVKDIIETELDGQLSLGTSTGGALFIIDIPIEKFEVL